MARRLRLDAELVRRGLARSRQQAQDLVESGHVSVKGTVATKAATQVEPETSIVVAVPDGEPGFVSRGGHKLVGALDAFGPAGLVIRGRRALDAGASTGGFTDVLLRRGVREVVAVDVGYGLLAWSLRTDPRVVTLDRTNVRSLSLADLGGEPADLVVGDLSFISLALVIDPLMAVCATGADLVLMVKPQFEVGRERVGGGGVVRDPALRSEAVRTIAERAWQSGLGTAGVVASPLPGPAGNVEYFLWLRSSADRPQAEAITRAVEEGPQ